MYTFEPHSKGQIDLVVTGDWTRQAAYLVTSRRVSGLVLNYARGFRERNLHFLEGLPIKRLQILARTIDDLSPIETLAGTLEELNVVVSPRARVDLRKFPLLRALSADWEHIENTIGDACALEELVVGSYSEASLLPLAVLPALTRLRTFDRPSVTSLDGLERLPHLVNLNVSLARELEDIDALNAPNGRDVSKLALEGCRKFPDLEPLANCVGLRELNVSECGDFPTLRPLRHLAQLERLLIYGQTRIGDGDLSPLLELPRLAELRMQQRRNYRPTVQDVQDATTARGETARGALRWAKMRMSKSTRRDCASYGKDDDP